jgi:hypothetical protein
MEKLALRLLFLHLVRAQDDASFESSSCISCYTTATSSEADKIKFCPYSETSEKGTCCITGDSYATDTCQQDYFYCSDLYQTSTPNSIYAFCPFNSDVCGS